MVQVETPQEVLVGLTRAAVRGDDQSWHVFQQLPWPEQGPVLDQVGSNDSGRGGIRTADAVVVMADHHDLVDALGRIRGAGDYRQAQQDAGQDTVTRDKPYLMTS